MENDSHSARAGRGFLWLTAAKLHFMLAGWAIYFVLPRVLDGEVAFGRFLVVVGLVSILNNVMVSSAIQGVSRFTAASPEQPGPALRAGLGIFLVVGLMTSGLLWAGAPLIARAESDLSLAPLYRAAALIALAYALYAACVGSLNGRQRFGLQAGFDATYATLRLFAILGGAALLASATGALAGYSAAAVVICAVAIVVVARGAASPWRRGNNPEAPVHAMMAFVLPLAGHQLGVNLLMRTDLLLVKALGGEAAAGTVSGAADAASVLAAHYGTAQIFALVPYQALIALSMVVFPLVAAAVSKSDPTRQRETALGALRFALIFGAGLAAALAANPEGIIDLVYPAAYRPGGLALRWLAWGVVGLSLLTLGCAMLNAAGHTGRVLGVTFAAWAVQVTVVIIALRSADSGPAVLSRAALASAAALLAAGAVVVVMVGRRFGAPLAAATLIRVPAGAALAAWAGEVIPGRSTLWTLGGGVATAVIYLAFLAATRELTGSDVAAVRRVLTGSRR